MRSDDGSSVPLILLFFLLGLVLVAGTVAASAAFLAQRDLQSDCDGAAIVAANALDAAGFYGSDHAGDSLPLAAGAAQSAVDAYAADAALAETSFAVAVAAGRAQVTCSRVVRLPFGPTFGYGDGLRRTAVSDARSPYQR
ncbi:pilus assembly protein TadG-related protein [Fodinicola acaciae]|uniref:pilus assembly protein TadG-related protein n=1 Tax=Fodinicola acaciae TaxID=2681555 RepID=UPI0013D7D6DB|nr:pilus assembly protein TadG-related protein [Fodinicola acaciae]